MGLVSTLVLETDLDIYLSKLRVTSGLWDATKVILMDLLINVGPLWGGATKLVAALPGIQKVWP